jgi:hypothetical protein
MLPVWLVLCLVIPMLSTSLECTKQAESGDSSHIISRIPRQRVESTAIAGVGYSRRRHILEIQFVNGAIYRYLDVPPAVHRDLLSAESKARFYDSDIRGHYRSVLVRPRQKAQTEN